MNLSYLFYGAIPVLGTVFFIMEVICFKKFYDQDKANSEFIFFVLGFAQLIYAVVFSMCDVRETFEQEIIGSIIASMISFLMGIVLILHRDVSDI